MIFMNPQKPIATCESDSCHDCAAAPNLHCHFSLKDWVHFLLVAIPPFLLGGSGIYYGSGWGLLPWILFLVAYFGFIEIRVMCSHCPHYAEETASLRCWANYGSPKPWKYRPGPMTVGEKIIFLGGLAVVWGYPLPFLIRGGQVFLLILYSLTSAGFFMTLVTFMCSRCMNFACSLNRVGGKERECFFEKNPVIAEAWRKAETGSPKER